jgi:putative phosphoribosyl transferase
MNDDYIYRDRKEAAELLATRLKQYENKNCLVLGIPRGGVETGYYVAKAISGELSVIICKKIPHPQQPEYGIGAIAEDGIAYLSPGHNVAPHVLEAIIRNVKAEIRRRVELYRKGGPLPDMKGRTVILTDDGIATGVTMAAAVHLCKSRGAERVVVASPVSGNNFSKGILDADEVIIARRPSYFSGVGQFYEDFSQLTDEDVLRFLNGGMNGSAAG